MGKGRYEYSVLRTPEQPPSPAPEERGRGGGRGNISSAPGGMASPEALSSLVRSGEFFQPFSFSSAAAAAWSAAACPVPVLGISTRQ
eukprot:scaffold102367_cov39-Tisochrysis_lutea.AAC.1